MTMALFQNQLDLTIQHLSLMEDSNVLSDKAKSTISSAIILLTSRMKIKKGKPVQPINRFDTVGPYGNKSGECPICGAKVIDFVHQRFCGNCGQEITWE